MKRKDIIRAIQEGTLTANEEYLEWTGGCSIGDSGVEGHLASVIARKLRKYQDVDESLFMECPFSSIREWSGAGRPPGRPPAVVSDSNRSDIVLFNKNRMPTCVIEVKRKWATKSCFKDLRRVNELVKRYSHQRNGSLRRGFLAVYLEKQQSVDDEIRKIQELVTKEFGGEETGVRFHSISTTKEIFENTWEFACLCIGIYARNRPISSR